MRGGLGTTGSVLGESHGFRCVQVFGGGGVVRHLRVEATPSFEVISIADGFEGYYERCRMSMCGGPGTSGLVRGGSFCVHASQVLGGSVLGSGDGVPSR